MIDRKPPVRPLISNKSAAITVVFAVFTAIAILLLSSNSRIAADLGRAQVEIAQLKERPDDDHDLDALRKKVELLEVRANSAKADVDENGRRLTAQEDVLARHERDVVRIFDLLRRPRVPAIKGE